MTVPISTTAPVPADDNRSASVPVQRGPLGNRDQVDDRANLAPADPLVDLGRRVWEFNFCKPNPLSDVELAEKFGATPDVIGSAVRAYLAATPATPTRTRKRRQTKAERQAEEASWWNQPTCAGPWWCPIPHGADDVHEMVGGVFSGHDAACTYDPATAKVYLEQDNPEQGPRVTLSITDGPAAEVPGFEGTQGWHGTPQQARALAAALYRLANIAEVAKS